MKIIVCVKQISHVYARTGSSFEQNFLADEDRVYCINPYDFTALEIALRVREGIGEGNIILLTLGPLIAEDALRRCFAMGADQICHLDVAANMDPSRKAFFLGHAARELGFDLVFCGKESLDRQNGQVPAYLAHYLRIPFVSSIREIAASKDKRSARVQRSAGRGMRQWVTCPLPALFSVDSGSVEPRLPTFAKKRQASVEPLMRLHPASEQIGSKITSMEVFPPRPRPKPVPAIDSKLDAFHRIRHLLKGSHTEKTGTILSGACEDQVEGILQYLEEHGFLKAKES
jgi:electron transfer flavoprotein beta subunit